MPPPIDRRTHGNKGQRHGVGNSRQFLWVVVYGNSGPQRKIVSSGSTASGRKCGRHDSHANGALELLFSLELARRQKGARRLLGFHLRPAGAQNFLGVLPGFPFVVVTVRWQQVDHMAEFMKQRDHLRAE